MLEDVEAMDTAEIEIESGYEEGTPWDGERRWVCKDELCGFDSLNEDRMRKHVEQYHMRSEKRKLIGTGLFDLNGKQIVREVDEEEGEED